MKLIAKTLYGLESILAEELKQIGATAITPLTRAVQFEGDLRLLYRANYELRTAIAILKPIASFKTKHPNHLYNKIQSIDWSTYINLNTTFAINAVSQSQYLTHSKFISLKVKDAIVDQLREKHDGQRPSIDIKHPDIRIDIHISQNNLCSVSLNSSGDALYKRGNRVAKVAAPINEILAAGMIKLAEWDKKTTFIDPMCGSGTILIEAASYAYNIPPQINRSDFAFKQWPDFDKKLWEEVVETANKNIDTNHEVTILGYDKSADAIQASQRNIEVANLADKITVKQRLFERLSTNEEEGLIIMNPPYDLRLEETDIITFYQSIGDAMKQHFTGFTVWIISSNLTALKRIGLKTSRKIPLFNGPLECRFQKYELYKGSKKTKKQP